MKNLTTATERKQEKLYLRSWEYNAALVLGELEKIVLKKGGAIVSTWDSSKEKRYLIINRSLLNAVEEQKQKVKIMEQNKRPNLEEEKKELERLVAIPNDPRESRNGSYLYLNFVLDGVYYSYNFDHNPLFDFHFSKIPTENNTIPQDRYSITDKKEWWTDKLWHFDITDNERTETAYKILKTLETSKTSNPYKGGRRNAKLYILEEGEQ